MALEISTVGAVIKYCIETTKGTRPTTGYTVIPDITTAPAIDLTTDSLDASNVTDRIKRYIAGQQDPGGDKTFTANHTEDFITKWEAMKEAADEAYASGKECWFEYSFPSPATKSFFFSGQPQALGTDEVGINAVHTISASVIVTGVGSWAAKSTT